MSDSTQSDLELFDAVRIVAFPGGAKKWEAYFSQTGQSHIKVGAIGVVIGDWTDRMFRVEAVNELGAILWQDHFSRDQLERLPPTKATYNRRRINEHWAWRLSLGDELNDAEVRRDALSFARKVMAFAGRNVDTLFKRLESSGYKFANHKPVKPPEKNVAEHLEKLAAGGVFIPIALQAWLLEVGAVDFRGTHPDWPRSGFSGMYNSRPDDEPWYTDPLYIEAPTEHLLKFLKDDTKFYEKWHFANCIEIAPDDITKADISGSGPISISSARWHFDNVLVGQHGSYTLLSYLRHAFAWGGFPGFDFIHDAPKEMLHEWSRDLIRL